MTLVIPAAAGVGAKGAFRAGQPSLYGTGQSGTSLRTIDSTAAGPHNGAQPTMSEFSGTQLKIDERRVDAAPVRTHARSCSIKLVITPSTSHGGDAAS